MKKIILLLLIAMASMLFVACDDGVPGATVELVLEGDSNSLDTGVVGKNVVVQLSTEGDEDVAYSAKAEIINRSDLRAPSPDYYEARITLEDVADGTYNVLGFIDMDGNDALSLGEVSGTSTITVPVDIDEENNYIDMNSWTE